MVDDLSAFYNVADGDAELVVVKGATVAALFERTSEVVLGDILTVAPTLRLPATSAVGVVDADVCTVRGSAYRVRQVQALPPDGRELLLVLAAG